MTGLKKSLAAISGVRSKFEEMLSASRQASPASPVWGAASSTASRTLEEIPAFGANPGELRMLVHVPRNPRPAPGLVVAMHGCGQTAEEFSQGTGWAALADVHGFIVVFPEQRQANNPKTCFSWFLPDDIGRERGETASIRQMTEHAIERFGADRRRVFVTGLSAGGAMASAQLAAYPETYAAGAIIAGLPYGCAGSMQEAFEAMFSEKAHAAAVLGEKVRRASGHRGPWPSVSVWHGSADAIVKPSNADHIVRQWLDVHGLASEPSHNETIGPHARRTWRDSEGRTAVEAFTLAGMPHAVPLDLTASAGPCGAPGPFFVDVGLSSTLHSARTWGLADVAYSTEQATAMRLGEMAWGQAQGATATDVVAAALRASGLPLPAGSPTAANGLDPRSIVEAALRQAGLKR